MAEKHQLKEDNLIEVECCEWERDMICSDDQYCKYPNLKCKRILITLDKTKVIKLKEKQRQLNLFETKPIPRHKGADKKPGV